MRYLRSMCLAGLALVACAMFSVPSMAAATVDPGLYAAAIEHPDPAVFTEAVVAPEHLAIVDKPVASIRHDQRSPGDLMPVYLASYRSDGLDIVAYHRRC